MKTIKRIQEASTLTGWGEINNNEGFIYADASGADIFFGFKLSDEWAALINADGEFFAAKKFKNCLASYDSDRFAPYSPNFKTLEECRAFLAA